MKKLFKTLAISLAVVLIGSGSAMAQTVAGSTSTATNAQQQSNAGFNNGQGQSQNAGANNGQGQLQGITLGGGGSGAGVGNNNSQAYTVAPAADLSRAVGNSYAPALTTTLTETCMGSTSMGRGFSGGSFSFGTTWRDHACVRRLDAREIRSYGDIQAAKEIMCDSDLVRDAFKRVGRPCAEDGGSYVAVSNAPAPAPEVVAPEAVAPMATEVPVKDDYDSSAQDNARILKKADEARETMRTKYGF